jgi:hypothetical protein
VVADKFPRFNRHENCKVENLREGEAPAEPKGLQNTAQRELRPPFFACHNDFADLQPMAGGICRLWQDSIQ